MNCNLETIEFWTLANFSRGFYPFLFPKHLRRGVRLAAFCAVAHVYDRLNIADVVIGSFGGFYIFTARGAD